MRSAQVEHEPVSVWPEAAVHIIDSRWQHCTMKAAFAAACRGRRGILERHQDLALQSQQE